MTRNEQLDRMTEEDKQADLLQNIDAHGVVQITSRSALAFWGSAVDALVGKGLVTRNLIEVEEQYSYLEVRKAKP